MANAMRKILIANRGEIARRIIRTAHAMGLETVAVYSDADALAPHVSEATQAVHIGAAPAAESYLIADKIIEAAHRTGADAVHPGYGFLSENAGFAEACAQAGLVFIGPPPSAIKAMGLKDQAKKIMKMAGVPVVPGYQGDDQTLDRLTRAAAAIGYPLLIKAVAGGGGKGMRRVDDAKLFAESLMACQREAARAFGNDNVLLERFVGAPRHVELQVFADSHGNAVHLFERDCSVQRRHQKVIEEAPAPGLSDDLRAAMGAAAVQAAKAIGYQGAGTIEFILDTSVSPPAFYFMEMNTRLQVEHPVTEAITGLDLVEWQIRVARGEALPKSQAEMTTRGHAIEVRLYAEDPDSGFLPSIGRLTRLRLPAGKPGIRVDSGVEQGSEVTVYYDPMIAKIIAHGPERMSAIEKLLSALDETVVDGVKTNRAFLARLLGHEAFRAARLTTAFIDEHAETLKAPAQVPDRITGLAAMALVTPRQAEAPTGSPWTALGPWRLNLPVARGVDLIGPSGPLSLRLVQEDRATRIDGLESVLRGHGRWRDDTLFEADFDGQLLRAGVLIRPDMVEVRAWGQTFLFGRPDANLEDASASGGDGQIKAPMPGRVLSVDVKAGQSVAAGDKLLTLEAMKMEHRLIAPGAGTVTAVHVSAGAQVTDGAVLIEIESS
jgi:3-methylcrotonyl-CoA carboxylase alpha subunit